MSLPVFFPAVRYVPKIEGQTIPLHQLCTLAGESCEAIGAWTQRPIVLCDNTTPALISEPGDWGAVKIVTPIGLSQQDQARWALGALAHVLFDGVARATVKGKKWSRATQ